MIEIINSFKQNWDLLTVGTVISLILILAFIVYFANNKSHTNKFFLGFSISTAIWGTFNYLSYQSFQEIEMTFNILRLTIFSVTWMTFFLLLFSISFPKDKIGIPKKISVTLFIWTIVVSILTLTSLVFNKIGEISSEGIITSIINGPAMPIFGMTTTIYALTAIFFLVRKTFLATTENKDRFLWITVGLVIMFISIIVSNFILPVVFNNTVLLPLAALFVFPFIAFTSYAIIKHHLLNIKVIGTEIFVSILLIINLVQLTLAKNFVEVLVQLGILVGIVIVSILVIKSVLKEVKQKEQIQTLAMTIEKANVKLQELDKLKSEFVSIASHQLRSPITSIKGYASLILEGSFGKISDSVREALQKIFDSSELMVTSVQDFLDVSRIEQGTMKYNFEVFDLKKVLKIVSDEQSINTKKKGLAFALAMDEKVEYKIKGDYGKIKQVISNIVDNSIKYTPKGSIKITLSKNEHTGKILIEVVDTGVGISPETLPKLFDRFVRAGNAHNVNVTGTGLGLFVAKQMVEKHKGHIWATSEGLGKGSQFHIELNEYRE